MVRPLACLLAAGLLLGAAGTARANVTVTLWTSAVSPRTLAEMVAAVDRALPGITLKATDFAPAQYRQALRRAASARLLPDILGVAPGAETQAVRGALIHLDAIADGALGKDWQKNYPAALLDEARLGNPHGDGGFFMLPMTTRVDGLWISANAAGRAQVASVPRSLVELDDAANRLRRAGIAPLVLGGRSDDALVRLFMQILAQTDPGLVQPAADGKAVWTGKPALEAARVWQQLFVRGIVPVQALGMSEKEAVDEYESGRAGMIAAGSGLLARRGTDEGKPPGRFFAFPPPRSSATPAPPSGGIGLGWAITTAATGQGTVKRACALVLRELLSGSAAQVAIDRLAGFPAWKGLAIHVAPPPADLGPYRQLQALTGKLLPDVIGDPKIAESLARQLRQLARNKTQPQAAMQAVNRTARTEQELAG